MGNPRSEEDTPLADPKPYLLTTIVGAEPKELTVPGDQFAKPGWDVIFPDGFRVWLPDSTFLAVTRLITDLEKNLLVE